VRRFLASKWIVSRTLYQPLIEEVLQTWAAREVTIILDGCFIRQKALQILRLSLSHCYRALPLAWEVVTNKGNVELDVCEAMLDHTMVTFPGGVQRAADQLGVKKGERRYLPNVQVTLEADWTCNLAITWTRATPSCPAELCVLMTNLRPSGWVLRHYLKRTHIEIVFTQMTKGGAFSRRTGGQDVPNLNLAVGDDHTIDEQFDQLPPLGEIQAV